MIALGNANAEICVVGRCDFSTGIGAITYGMGETLSRSFPTCILPTEPHLRERDEVVLPNGRRLPVCRDPGRIKASFFCDVLWNGAHDFNYALMPPDSLKYAYLVHDSDELPSRWAQLLNEHFDLVLAASPEMIPVARASRVETPIATMPIPLDLDALLAEAMQPPDRDKVRFGSLAAFHPRKDVGVLLEGFLSTFGDRADVELVLHSNLAFGDTLERLRRTVEQAGARNVVVSHGALPEAEKNRLIRTFDVFVNCSRGEGYSIGPREALAMGKTLVLSDVGGHRDLADIPGVFTIPAEIMLPARFPEIDNGVFGRQRAVCAPSVSASLEQAFAFVRSGEHRCSSSARRDAAAEFGFSRLADGVAALVDPSLRSFRRLRPPSPRVSIPEGFRDAVVARLGRRASRLGHERRRVVAAHDGGFFSIFNAFMSYLTWDQREDRCHGVLPDWDVDRFLERQEGRPATSFCYGQPGDGNIWLKLFEPLYGHTADDMEDAATLYRDAGKPYLSGDYAREPLMTYVHAYKLYRSRSFAGWRRQFHQSFRAHVRLRPDLLAEVDVFVAARLDRPFLIAAHVRHPSHTVEQPGALIAHADGYISRILAVLAERSLALDDHGWGVFLATDQERVVHRFREAFGERVACFDDVRRTRADEDAVFDALSPDERNRDGHQLQHLVAATPQGWSVRMAREVVRDAYVMARCHVLLHVVSNVSTAVAYMNPDLEMIFCSPHQATTSPDERAGTSV